VRPEDARDTPVGKAQIKWRLDEWVRIIRVNALSPERMRRLPDELGSKLASQAMAGTLDLTPEEMAEQELQRRLVAAGLHSEIKPSPRFMPLREPFTPIPIEGEPLSETVIRERR
jgi:hypothetical protein